MHEFHLGNSTSFPKHMRHGTRHYCMQNKQMGKQTSLLLLGVASLFKTTPNLLKCLWSGHVSKAHTTDTHPAC